MTSIIINGFERAEGEVAVSNRIDLDVNGKQVIVTEGMLIIDKYFDEIDLIETENFTVKGVYVVEETFSTETKNIIYKFVADELERSEY